MENIGSRSSRRLRVEVRKNLKNVNYYVCDNGLGHIKRSTKISKILSKHYKIKLFTDTNKLSKFKVSAKIRKKKFKFQTGLKSIDKNLIKKIKNLKINERELILSDNYPDFCILKNPFILYANFFWHEIFSLKNIDTKFITKNLIKKKIPVIGNYIFQSLQNKKINSKKVGFIGSFKGNIKKNKKVLVSLGTANIKKKVKIKLISQITEELKKQDNNIKFYLDESYFLIFKKYKNVFLANYSNKMFKEISVCIAKPGMGIINDCLKHGVILITLNSFFNKEFKNNSKLINKYKLGYSVKSFKSAVQKLHQIFKDKLALKKFYLKYKSLKWNGEQEILKIIKKNY